MSAWVPARAKGRSVTPFGAVTSWRDTSSALAQDDLDTLLNALLPFAEDQLAKNAEFYPFAGSISFDGEATLVAADPGLGEHPASDQVLTTLYEGARANANASRAFAFVADVRANGSDAVRLELEHREGTVLVLLLPYTRSRFKKAVTFGQMSVSPGAPRIWLTA